MMVALLSRRDRRELTARVADLLARYACTATRLASELNATTREIHSVLVSLRSEGVIEPVALFLPPEPESGQVLWHLSLHGQQHGVGDRLPGTPQCAFCRRAFADW